LAVEESHKQWLENLTAHFQRIQALEALGKRTGDRTVVTVAAGDKRTRKHAEQVLQLLGWKVQGGKKGIVVDQVVKGEKAKRQETASALAIDEIGMEQALEAGKPFDIEIVDEFVHVFPAEARWKAAFYEKENPPGGLFTVLGRDLRLAKLYVGLNAMNNETALLLADNVGLPKLANEYADSMYRYGSAITVKSGRVIVPGGHSAEQVWSQLVGASPNNPKAFLPALVKKNDGRLLAFYYAVAQLDSEHQAFVTRSAQRTSRFYELFGKTPEQKQGGHLDSAFIDFMRDVPLSTDGSVRFPGSPEVWMVVKGQSSSVAKTAKLMKKVAKAAAPDVEDEILIRLARTRYEQGSTVRSELDNFLAVARIDERRKEPLTEGEAVLLAQQFARFENFYPYLAIFSDLKQADYERLFQLAAKFDAMEGIEGNNVIGQFLSLVELIALLEGAGAVDGPQAAELFRAATDLFAGAATEDAYSAASLKMAARLGATSLAIRDRLIPPSEPVNLEFRSTSRTYNFSERRRTGFARVLELQKITDVETFLGIDKAFATLTDPNGNMAEAMKALERNSAELLHVPLPKDLKARPEQNDLLEGFRLERIAGLVRETKQKAARKKVNRKDFEKLRREMLQALRPQITVCLAGLVYAYYADPADLIVADDPLLVRKHNFIYLKGTSAQKAAFVRASFEPSSEGAGSFFRGTFAAFPLALGNALAPSVQGNSSYSQAIVAAQLATVRSTVWRGLSNIALQELGLSVRAGREWITQAAADSAVAEIVADHTAGLLPLNRRTELLTALEHRDWKSVWESVTLSDLYFLGLRLREHLDRASWPSPVIEALRGMPHSSNMDVLGSVPFETLEYSRPMLAPSAPYEEFARYMMPYRLAERAAEAKLHCAYYLDQSGLPAEALPSVAEPVARALIGRLHMADTKDWKSAIDAWSALNDDVFEGALNEP
jgi:hypothetical protein